MNSEQVSSGVNNDIIDKKIGELQTKLDKINKNRKISVIISVVGVVLIVIAVLIFFSNLTKFVKHYDVSALMSELQVSSSHFASSEEAKELVHILKQDLLPAYELAVAAKLKESAPVFRSDFDEIKQSVAIHMTEVIKPRLEENLVSCLANSEAVALAENFTTPESVAKIDKVVALTKEHLIEKMPTFIDKRIDPLLVKLASLNSGFYSVYDSMVKSGEFEGITVDMTGEIENRLIENILEMMIYELNPQKANQPAN